MTSYFVASSGSNANAGTSSGSPWLDTTNVNTTAFQGGDTVSFHGGDTISGAISIDASNWGGTNQWDASHKSVNITISGKTNNLLTASQTSDNPNSNGLIATLSQSSGKWVYSVLLTTSLTATGSVIGVGTVSTATASLTYVGIDTQSVGVVTNDGRVFFNNANIVPAGGTVFTGCAAGDRVWVAVDITNQTIQFAKNTAAFSSPLSISGLAGFTLFPAASMNSTSAAIVADFNSVPVPATLSGFSVWNASNPTVANPVTFGSYGTGQATISSSALAGFASLDIGNFTLQNLTLVGSGIAANTVSGVSIQNSQAGISKMTGVTITNLDVSAYGRHGIVLAGTAGNSGFSGATISSCVVLSCGGGAMDWHSYRERCWRRHLAHGYSCH